MKQAMDDRRFVERVLCEVAAARVLFPEPGASMTALTEEVGELAKALLDEPWNRVVAEAIQVAAMALRVAVEGDPTLTEERRARNKAAHANGGKNAYPQGLGPRCPYLGCPDPVKACPPCALCYE
jgi:hypothetical protein